MSDAVIARSAATKQLDAVIAIRRKAEKQSASSISGTCPVFSEAHTYTSHTHPFFPFPLRLMNTLLCYRGCKKAGDASSIHNTGSRLEGRSNPVPQPDLFLK